MKRLVTPDDREGYKPSGIYALPVSQRRQKVFDLFDAFDEEKDLTKERIRALQELRGAYR